MASKPKSTLPETPNKKTSPATPSRVSKLGRGLPKTEGDSPSPMQNSSRLSLDRSVTRSTGSKPSIDAYSRSATAKQLSDRRSPRLSTPPEKAATESELQEKLNHLQDDLKKSIDQLAVLEKEKVQAINELKEAQRLADAANERLSEALVAQKRAEEDSEIEKFRALEFEQVGIEITQKKEEEWMKEIGTIKSLHAIDVGTLLSTTQELQRLKEELSMTSDAKNQALSHADDATKIAEIHAEKAEALSKEIIRLKTLLDSTIESEAKESKMVSMLNLEVDSLKHKIERFSHLEEKVGEQDATLEHIIVELEAARMSEAYAHNLLKEWKDRVESLECQVEEAKQSERTASESVASARKQLEEKEALLQESQSEISGLKEKIGLLEVSLERHRVEFLELEHHVVVSKEEIFQLSQTVEAFKSELHNVQEEKLQALNSEKLAALTNEKLLEEKKKLILDIEVSKDEEEKSQKAMESLAAALHEVSSEAREAKESLLSSQAENKQLENQIEDMKNAMEVTKGNYKRLLDEAKCEIAVLTNTVEHSNYEFDISKTEWLQREKVLAASLKQLEEEKLSGEIELARTETLLKQVEEEALVRKEEEVRLKDSLKAAETEAVYLREGLSEVKAGSIRLKKNLTDKETELQNAILEKEELQTLEAASLQRVNELSKLLEEANAQKKTELQSINQENEFLRAREAASLKKVEELSKLLEEAYCQEETEENGDITDSDKDYDLLPKVVEFSVENGNADGREDVIKLDLPSSKPELHEKHGTHGANVHHTDKSPTGSDSAENGNDFVDERETKQKDEKTREGGAFKMWESCQIDERECSPSSEAENNESFDKEADSMTIGGDSFDQISATPENDSGSTSPSKLQKKKKKPLLSKFGSLLKKKSSPGPSPSSQK